MYEPLTKKERNKFLMEIKDIMTYVQRSPQTLEQIKRIMDYRNLRIKQAYYAKLSYQYDHQFQLKSSEVCKLVRNAGEFDRSFWKDASISLDKQRRATHNRALSGFSSMVNKGRIYGLPQIYKGRVLDEKEIAEYSGLDIRAQMTDGMFELINVLENNVININLNQEKSENNGISQVFVEMKSFNKEYRVKKSMEHDEDRSEDGGIEFDLSTIFDDIFKNGKENL